MRASIDASDGLLADKASLARLQMPNPLGGGRMHAAVNALSLMKDRVGNEKSVMGWVEGSCDA